MRKRALAVAALSWFLMAPSTTTARADEQIDNIFAPTDDPQDNQDTQRNSTDNNNNNNNDYTDSTDNININNNRPCSLCRNGTTMTLPDKTPIKDGLLGGQPCFQINQWIGLLYTTDSEECQTIQSLGTMCGCPLVVVDEPNAAPPPPCTLCPNGGLVTKPDKPLPLFSNLAVFVETIGAVPTCDMFQAYLLSSSTTNSNNNDDNGLCRLAHEYMADYCGCNPMTTTTMSENDATTTPSMPCSICPIVEDKSTAPLLLPSANKTLNLDGFPFETCGDLEDAASLLLSEGSRQCDSLKGFGHHCGCPATTTTTNNNNKSPCTLCPDGTPVPLPNKPYPGFRDAFGGFVPTCALVESSLLSTTHAGSDQCETIQLVGSYCGCPPLENHCRFCPGMDTLPPEYTDTTVPIFRHYFGEAYSPSITCNEIWFAQYQLPSHGELCFFGRQGAYLCGCNGGESTYINANTLERKAVLAWIPRVTGSLSILGSLFIMVDVLRDPRRRNRVYNRIVFLLSCSDILASIAMAFSTLPIESDSRVYGARGNSTTCNVQGFFVQFLSVSLLYNLMLATYFYISLKLGWSEHHIRRYQFIFFALPLVVGLSLAVWGIPEYKNVSTWCHIDVPPVEDSWTPAVVLVVIPSGVVSALATVMMVAVYLKVRHQFRRMRRWTFRGTSVELNAPRSARSFTVGGHGTESRRRDMASDDRTSHKPDRQVFWQAVLYLSAFYVTCTVQTFLAFHAWSEPHLRDQPSDIYPVWVLYVTFAPLQGFWNAFIYFRPRIIHQRLRQRTRTPNESVDDNNDHPSQEEEEEEQHSESGTDLEHEGAQRRCPSSWTDEVVGQPE